jgi:integrase/recombinase XerC
MQVGRRPESPSLEQAISAFEAHLIRSSYADATVRTYGRDIVYWRRWLIENASVENVRQLEREDIAEYLASLSSSSSSLDFPTKRRSATTIKKKLAALRKFAAFVFEEGYHDRDITAGVKSPRVARREPAFLNQHEYRALLFEAQRRNKPRDYAILMTFLQTGVREGELVRLELEDLDRDRRELSVKRRKGGVDTVIPLSSPVIDALLSWLSVRPTAVAGRLFISKTGRPLSERLIRHLVRYYMARAGIRKQASTHTLRHTFGAFKSAKNVDLKTLQYWMGHRRAETTLHYLHLVKKRAPELMEATAL